MKIATLQAPLGPMRLSMVLGGAVLFASSYCVLHGIAGGTGVNLALTVPWAITLTAPFVLAVELGKRSRVAPALALVAGAAAVSIAVERLWLGTSESMALEVFRRVPLVVLCASALLALRQTGTRVIRGPIDLPMPLTQIEHVRSAGNYVEVFHRDGSTLVRATLARLEVQLNDPDFVRVHRTAILRRSRVDFIESDGPKHFAVTVSGARIPISPSKRRVLRNETGMA